MSKQVETLQSQKQLAAAERAKEATKLAELQVQMMYCVPSM